MQKQAVAHVGTISLLGPLGPNKYKGDELKTQNSVKSIYKNVAVLDSGVAGLLTHDVHQA